jgi:tetratricopeptide (TPR) repeat protein
MPMDTPSSRRGHVWRYDPEGDIARYTLAIEHDPADTWALARRAAWQWMKGDRNAAIADFSRLIELDPTDARAYGERGQLRKLEGDLDGAIADYTASITHDPSVPVTYLRRSAARRLNGDADGATDDDKKASSLRRDCKRKRTRSLKRLSHSQIPF